MFRDRFELSEDKFGDLYLDSRSGIFFRRVKGATYRCGLSSRELALIRGSHHEFDEETLAALTPDREKKLGAFLIADRPVSTELIERSLKSSYLDDEEPPMISLFDAREFCKIHALELPTYWELETAFRGGRTGELFPFGDELLTDDELDFWMDIQFKRSKKNSIGLSGVLWGGWTITQYSSIADGYYEFDVAVKTPAAGLWPWQDDEWIFCLNAMHIPSSLLPIEDACALWPIFRL